APGPPRARRPTPCGTGTARARGRWSGTRPPDRRARTSTRNAEVGTRNSKASLRGVRRVVPRFAFRVPPSVHPRNSRTSRSKSPSAHAVLPPRSEEHTSELQSRSDLVCRLLLEKKKKQQQSYHIINKISTIT